MRLAVAEIQAEGEPAGNNGGGREGGNDRSRVLVFHKAVTLPPNATLRRVLPSHLILLGHTVTTSLSLFQPHTNTPIHAGSEVRENREESYA